MSKSVELRVIVSTIEGQGKAWLNADAFGELQLIKGDRISVMRGEKGIVVQAHKDSIYAPGVIRLTAADAAALGASENYTVKVFDGEIVPRLRPEPKKKKRR